MNRRMMGEKDLQNRRTPSAEPGHEFEAPIVKELPREMEHTGEWRQTTSTHSDATLSDASKEDCRSASSDAPPPADRV
jgi:hypothetical protein